MIDLKDEDDATAGAALWALVVVAVGLMVIFLVLWGFTPMTAFAMGHNPMRHEQAAPEIDGHALILGATLDVGFLAVAVRNRRRR